MQLPSTLHLPFSLYANLYQLTLLKSPLHRGRRSGRLILVVFNGVILACIVENSNEFCCGHTHTNLVSNYVNIYLPLHSSTIIIIEDQGKIQDIN